MQDIQFSPKLELTLADMPAAIYAHSMRLNRCEDLIGELKQELARIEVDVDLAIASDTDLKNDGQRKAKRNSTLLEHDPYQLKQAELAQVTRDRADVLATLELYRNLFAVKKLEVRMAIASKMVGLDSVDLLGV